MFADWISAVATVCTTVIAGYAAKVALATLKQQRTSSDVNLSLQIFAEINRYWDSINESKLGYEFKMGQILSQFEIAASLFNKGIFSDNANDILGDHIVEVFTAIQSDAKGKQLLESCCSAPTTFEQLKKFARSKMPKALTALEFSEKKPRNCGAE